VRLEGVWSGGAVKSGCAINACGKSGAQQRRVESPGRREE